MPWGLWSSASSQAPEGSHNRPYMSSANNSDGRVPPPRSSPASPTTTTYTQPPAPRPPPPPSQPPRRPISWNDSLNGIDWQHYKEVRNWVPTIIATTAALGIYAFYRSYLRRLPGAGHVHPGYFRRRSLLGKVTSVGDGDNFHLFHTPGGRLAGWGWLRKVPEGRKEARGRTIPIRLAGIDAPEGAHFGRTAQPYAAEALAFLQSYLQGRRVRAYIYKRDQYDRIVATVYIRRPPFFFPRKDVGLEMLRRGLATTYEAKSGAEFGGPLMELKYKGAEEEARRSGKGMWAFEKGSLFGLFKGKELESPRNYKERVKAEEKAAADKKS